jgi:hypothetical protein
VPEICNPDRAGADCCKGAISADFPAAFFLRARRFKVAVSFKGLRSKFRPSNARSKLSDGAVLQTVTDTSFVIFHHDLHYPDLPTGQGQHAPPSGKKLFKIDRSTRFLATLKARVIKLPMFLERTC